MFTQKSRMIVAFLLTVSAGIFCVYLIVTAPTKILSLLDFALMIIVMILLPRFLVKAFGIDHSSSNMREAIRAYNEEGITIRHAAEIADVSFDEMWERLKQEGTLMEGIPDGLVSEEELAKRRASLGSWIHKNRLKMQLPDEVDLSRFDSIWDKALQLFDDDGKSTKEWFEKPNLALGSKAPIEVCQTEEGSREVENLIDRLENGVYS